MQPFGLLNLLKSALFSEISPSAPQNESNRETSFLSAPTAEKTTETTTQPPQTASSINASQPIAAPTSSSQSEKQNACLDFLLRHEERAGRQKRGK